MTKFGIRKKNLRRGKVEKSSTFLFQKKLNLRYYLPRLTLGTMDTNVVCSQSPSLTYVIQVVRMLLDDTRHVSGHIEYMKYKKLTIVSKSYLSQLKWLCLIGWCLAISIFLAILLLSVR